MVIKKGTCLFFLKPYFWRYVAIIIAIKVIAIRSEPTFNVKTPWMTVLSPKIFCTCQNNKRKRVLFYDSLLEEDYDDYEENEQEQDMWNNIATLAEVLENKPPTA